MLSVTEHVTKLIDNYRDACFEQIPAKTIPARHKLEEFISRYKQALEGLTPGGSEFVDAPERCAEFVRSRLDNQQRNIIRLTKEKNSATSETNTETT